MSKTSEAPKTYAVSLLDLAVLLLHVHKGAEHPEVGFEDADRSIEELTKLLQVRKVEVQREALESALWSCNLMDEEQVFWSPKKESFILFAARLLNNSGHYGDGTLTFDRQYNNIKFKPYKRK